MKRLLSAVLLLDPLVAGAQVVSTTPPVDQPPTAQPQAVPPPPPATLPPAAMAPVEPLPQDDAYAQPSVPPSSVYGSPDVQEPLPPATAVAPPSASGQWVYTTQYGWIWMPYGTGYTYLPASAYPDMYVYTPAYGWRWVVAPWVWGLGPRPYFGVYGWNRFAWYGRGFGGRWYGYRGGPVWASRGWYGAPAHRGYPGAVVRPAPHVVAPRPGVVVTRPGGFARPGVVVRPGPVVRSAPVARSAPAPRTGGFSGHAVGHVRR